MTKRLQCRPIHNREGKVSDARLRISGKPLCSLLILKYRLQRDNERSSQVLKFNLAQLHVCFQMVHCVLNIHIFHVHGNFIQALCSRKCESAQLDTWDCGWSSTVYYLLNQVQAFLHCLSSQYLPTRPSLYKIKKGSGCSKYHFKTIQCRDLIFLNISMQFNECLPTIFQLF